MSQRRWIAKDQKYGENPKIDSFLDEIEQVCKKHGFLISHEDTGGSFVIVSNTPKNHTLYMDWLKEASDYTNQQ